MPGKEADDFKISLSTPPNEVIMFFSRYTSYQKKLNSKKIKCLEMELEKVTAANKVLLDEMCEKSEENEYLIERNAELMARNQQLKQKYAYSKTIVMDPKKKESKSCGDVERLEKENAFLKMQVLDLRKESKNSDDVEILKNQNASLKMQIRQLKYNQRAKRAVQSKKKKNNNNNNNSKKRVYSEVVTVTPPKKKLKNRMKKAVPPTSPSLHRRNQTDDQDNEASPAIIRTDFTTPRVAEDSKNVRSVKSAPALTRQRSTTNTTYKYSSVVRGKEARSKLKGRKCKECEAFLKVMESALGSENAHKLCQSCSRHRQEFTPENTPDGFWNIAFADSLPVGEKI